MTFKLCISPSAVGLRLIKQKKNWNPVGPHRSAKAVGEFWPVNTQREKVLL